MKNEYIITKIKNFTTDNKTAEVIKPSIQPGFIQKSSKYLITLVLLSFLIC